MIQCRNHHPSTNRKFELMALNQGRTSFFLGIIVFLSLLQSTLAHNDCIPIQCSKNGPIIRFPFRLKERQPQHCGYPGFDVSCSDSNDAMLLLPVSVQVHITKIDYSTQFIHIQEHGGCFTQIRFLNLSASHFNFTGTNSRLDDFTIFSCLPKDNDSQRRLIETCLDDPHDPARRIYAIDSFTGIDSAPILSCKKMYNISRVPSYVLVQDYDIRLQWPHRICGDCEAQGKYCRFRNNIASGNGTECYGQIEVPTDQQGVHKSVVIALIVVGLFILLTSTGVVCYIRKQKKKDEAKIEKFLEAYRALRPARYSYADIKKITGDFKEKVGEGAYGTVFKGTLSNDIHVAVKILNSSKGNGQEFINEVGIMGKIHHVNIVRLVGYCADGFRRALIYEFFSNDSLEKYILSDAEKSSLGWKNLESIALGIAKGIEYLHQGCEQRIVHFDIKPHNVLLDSNLIPKISDFGQAKLCSKEQGAVSMTTARGTIGYIAPEVFSRNFGSVSHKSDVYSFGMLLLGMVGGKEKKNDDVDRIYYPEWIYNQLDGGEGLVGVQVMDEGDDVIVRKLAIVGLWCIQWYPIDRPSMNVVVQMLEGNGGSSLTIPSNPFVTTNPDRLSFNSQLEVIVE
ncbi:rust resistance kinase Lr10-like [Impatiens glandulifera]|uniref:rust resistance kinase Lr10-like n=1 Tax=Impatiens glandulifera TaxID=253017 RepID=UPI001FB0CDF5|nr:rust resistance kinase Lr10-like [Impatiens glandulifera]